jgi:hypothetical protein
MKQVQEAKYRGAGEDDHSHVATPAALRKSVNFVNNRLNAGCVPF